MLRFCADCFRRSFIAAITFAIAVVAVVMAVGVVIFAVFAFVDPTTSAVMLREQWAGRSAQRVWVPLDAVSRHAVRAIVGSEDARFCRHHGIDIIEMDRVVDAAVQRGDFEVRGASTISMQTVKNLLLWTEPNLIRKAIEVTLSPIMEVIWGKRRVLEVYLNIAQWGPGVFGIEAGARHHFGKSASDLSAREAALMAVVLPSPATRRAGRPRSATRRRAERLWRRMKGSRIDLSCVTAAR